MRVPNVLPFSGVVPSVRKDHVRCNGRLDGDPTHLMIASSHVSDAEEHGCRPYGDSKRDYRCQNYDVPSGPYLEWLNLAARLIAVGVGTQVALPQPRGVFLQG